jgi:competence protein ComEC
MPAAQTGLLQQARAQGVRVIQPRSGEVRRFGPVTIRILAPFADYVPGSSAKNNDSLVLEITYGQRRFLLTGDAERNVELELVNRALLQHVDVLKVAHHGSKTSTLPDVLSLLRPSFAVISVGEGNLYNHPHPDVSARMHDYKIQAFRTDRAGLTSFRTNGKRLLVDTNGMNWKPD